MKFQSRIDIILNEQINIEEKIVKLNHAFSSMDLNLFDLFKILLLTQFDSVFQNEIVCRARNFLDDDENILLVECNFYGIKYSSLNIEISNNSIFTMMDNSIQYTTSMDGHILFEYIDNKINSKWIHSTLDNK